MADESWRASDLLCKYDYCIHHCESTEYHRGYSDAELVEMKAEAERKHNEWLRHRSMSLPIIRVPLWMVEGILSEKFPNLGLKYLLEPDANGVIHSVQGLGLAIDGFVELWMKGPSTVDKNNNSQSLDHIPVQVLRHNGEAIDKHAKEHGIGCSSASSPSTKLEKDNSWYSCNCTMDKSGVGRVHFLF